ncbi:hypothetical protein THAOC_35599, partial [Thalassiosira oceanica]
MSVSGGKPYLRKNWVVAAAPLSIRAGVAAEQGLDADGRRAHGGHHKQDEGGDCEPRRVKEPGHGSEEAQARRRAASTHRRIIAESKDEGERRNRMRGGHQRNPQDVPCPSCKSKTPASRRGERTWNGQPLPLVRLQDDFHFPINKFGPYSSEVAPGTDWPQLVALMDTEAYDMCNRELKLETSICPATSDQILHNEDLMPAWTRYADALRLSKIHMINIDNVEFSAPALRKLTFALGNKKLFSLSWTRSSCLDVNAGIDFVASAARRLDADGNQKHFRPHFSWSNCAIPDLDAANRLCDALSSVKRVNFIDSCGESQIIGATILGSLINADKRIVELSLINNRVTGLDRGHATSLADNTWLERLDLSHNHLNDEDAAVIAHWAQAK